MEQISKVSAVKRAMDASGFSAEEAGEFDEESCVKLFDNGIKTHIRLQVSDDTITIPICISWPLSPGRPKANSRKD